MEFRQAENVRAGTSGQLDQANVQVAAHTLLTNKQCRHYQKHMPKQLQKDYEDTAGKHLLTEKSTESSGGGQ